MLKCTIAAVLASSVSAGTHIWSREEERARGIQTEFPERSWGVATKALPSNFTWANQHGLNMLTETLNQHIPQYCGSCWAHGTLSALADRIKIDRFKKARKGEAVGPDINLSVQHMLNCGNAGSCHGGSIAGPYQWIQQISEQTGSGISYATSQPYLACSKESTEGFCKMAEYDWTCKPINIARTCNTFTANGGKCDALSHYPNATVSDFGVVSGAEAMQKEVFEHGPIACGVDDTVLKDYAGGIIASGSQNINHVISVVGWGNTAQGKQYWIVRNSWGEFWGDMGYFYVAMGENTIGIETSCSWATVKDYTTQNFPCHLNGGNCQVSFD
jgi:cathepsin X